MATGNLPQRGPLEPCDDGERRVLAWAVKDLGYAALYTDAGRVRQCLARLHALGAAVQAPGIARELAALHAWLEGAACALRGDAAGAVQQLDAAYEGLVACGRHHEAASSQVPKLIALALLGRHDEALACGERTLGQLDAAGDAPGAGRVEINLGSMLLRRHRHADAAVRYRRAAVRFARAGDVRHSVMADIGLATALGWMLDFDEAARIFDRAAARVAAHGLDDLRGTVDHNRGLHALRRGRHGDALHWLAAALAQCEREGTPQRVAETRRGLADAYLALNLLPEAVSLYDEAIAECRRHPAATEEAWATMQRARALASLGREPEAARGLAEARRLFQANGHPVGAARGAAHEAALALRGGLAQRALKLAAQAAAEFAAARLVAWQAEAELLVAEAQVALGDLAAAESQLAALQQAADEQPELLARVHTLLARLALGRGDRPGARSRFEAAATHVESQRAALPGDEFRTAYGAERLAPFEALLELALDEDGAAGAVLSAMERARSVSLELARAEPAAAPDARRRAQLAWLQQQRQEAVARGERARADELAGQLQACEAEALERHRRAEATRLAPVRTEGSPLDTAALQAALGGDEAMVCYGWAGARLTAVVVTPNAMRCHELDGSELGPRLQQLRFQIDTLRFGAAGRLQHAGQLVARAQAHLQALHERLWEPLRPTLEGRSRVHVVPGGLLHCVPWAALHDGQDALLDRHALQLAPGARMWLAARLHQRARPAGQAPARAVVLGLGGPTLPQVAVEVEAVQRALAAATSTAPVVLRDAQATLPALRAALPGADLVHLACHGRFRTDSPYFSSLQLADGELTLRDAASLPLADALVVLSACETGLSRVAPGDEMLGLARGFLVAGAAGVLATLWKVQDAGTAALMGDFYRALAAGVAAPLALRQAQRALREQEPHPGLWAPFILHGGY